jgi:hypothetical protein
MRRLLVELGKIPGTRAWRQNAGVAVLESDTGERRALRAAPKGAADLSGLFGPRGTRLEVETKSPGEEPTEEQVKWRAMIERHGGLYVVCRYDASMTMDQNVAAATASVRAAIEDRRREAGEP